MRPLFFIVTVLLMLIGTSALISEFSERAVSYESHIVHDEPLRVYVNGTYGYSFEYPVDLDVREFIPEALAVGTKRQNGAFDALAEVLIAQGGSEAYETFDAFVFAYVRTMCAAEGAEEIVFCDHVVDLQPFTATSGLEGSLFYLNRIHEQLETGVRTYDLLGPLIVYKLMPQRTESQYRVILIRPPVFHGADEVNGTFVRSIATSFQMNRVQMATRDGLY